MYDQHDDSTVRQIIDMYAKGERLQEFRQLDRKTLGKKTDIELAEWQSQYPTDSPQYILAEHEWQRRLTSEEIKASRFAAFMGLLGAVVGAFITWLTTK